nr:hypothetical protein [Tanacetum cinerariifolium]GEY54839.1 hypothetical protein [Tanacetum cinerariifolium]
MANFEKYRVTLLIINNRKAIKEMVRVNLTWIHTFGTNGIPMILSFLRYDLGRNLHENRVTMKQSSKWRFVVTSIDQRDVVWLELESGYASWNVGHLQQKAKIKLRVKTVLDLVSNVSSMDMLRLKLTKLPLKVTAQRSLGNKDDDASDHTKFKKLMLEQAIPLDRIDPSQPDNYLMKDGQTCFTSVKSYVPDCGLRSLGVDAAMRPHITDRHMQQEQFTGTLFSHDTETYVHVQSKINIGKDYIMLI